MSQEHRSQKSAPKIAANGFGPMANNMASYAMLRGGRLAKMGRRVVSFAPVVGLVGVAAVFGAGEAQANCTVNNAGGTFTCDVNTYTPGDATDGVTANPGTATIGGTFFSSKTQNKSVSVSGLVINAASGSGVTLMTTSPGAQAFSTAVTVQGSDIRSANHGVYVAEASGPLTIAVNDSVLTSGTTASRNGLHSSLGSGADDMTITVTGASELRSNSAGSAGILAASETSHAGNIFIDFRGSSTAIGNASNGRGIQATKKSGTSGDINITLSDSASAVSNGGQVAIVAEQVSGATSGDINIRLNDDSRVSATATGIYAYTANTNTQGDINIVLNDDAEVDASMGIWGAQQGIGDLNIQIGSDAAVSSNGVGNGAIRAGITNSANSGEISVTVDGTLDVTGNISSGVSSSNVGSGDTTITLGATSSITAGNPDGSNTGAAAVVATSTGAGDVIINAGGAVVANGTNAVGISGNSMGAGTGDVTINADTGGSITVAGANSVAVGGEITNSASDGALTINVAGDVSASGDGSAGVGAANDGSGDISIASIGNISAVGTGAFGIAIDTTSGSGGFQLDLDAGSVSGDQAAVNIDTGTGSTGAVNIASGVTVGAGTGQTALNITGSGSGVVTNAGTVLGGVNVLGDFVNATSGTVTVSGGQGFSVSNDLVNNGVIDAADGVAGDVISVGGDLSGNGVFLLDVDLTSGTTDNINVNGDMLTGSTVKIDAKVVSGQVSDSSGALLADILTVDGTVADGTSVVVDAGLMSFSFTGADGVLTAPVVRVSAKGQVYVAAPVALASNFTRIASTQARFNNRVYMRQAGSTRALGFSVPAATGVQVASLDGLMWLAYADELSRAAPQSANKMAPRQSGAWASLTTDRLKHSRSTGAQLKDTYHEFEGGFDRVVSTNLQGTLVVGTSAHIGSLSSKMSNPSSSTESNLSSTGFGVGLGATYFLTNGTYLDGNIRVSKVKSDIDSAGVQLVSDVKSTSVAGSVELGRRFELSAGGSITPSVQLSFGETKMKGFTDSRALLVESSTQKTHKSRVGLAFENALPGANEGSTYRLSANYVNDFSPTSRVSAGGTTLTSKGKREWLDFGVGATLVTNAKSRVTFDAAYSFAKGARSTNNGLRATVGYQMNF